MTLLIEKIPTTVAPDNLAEIDVEPMPGESNDRIPDELVLRAQAGDTDAQEEALRLATPIAYKAAHGFNTAAVGADDIAQDSLLKVFKSGILEHSYEPRVQGSFNAWIKGVVRNTLLDAYRTQTRRKTASCEAEIIDRMLEETNDTSEVEPGWSVGEILAAAKDAGVSNGMLSPLILEELYGYREADVAEILAIKAGTVKSRKNKACALLSEQLVGLAASR